MGKKIIKVLFSSFQQVWRGSPLQERFNCFKAQRPGTHQAKNEKNVQIPQF